MKLFYIVMGLLTIAIVTSLSTSYVSRYSFSQSDRVETRFVPVPVIKDPTLRAELVYRGISFPSSFAFLGHDDILVLEKETGKVRRIINGQMLEEPLLDVNVARNEGRGLLGIATTVSTNYTYVFLFYTESNSTDGADVDKGEDPIGNRLYRYTLSDNKLTDPRLLLDLPAIPGYYHVGGAITIGPDNYIYLVVGDIDHHTEAQNNHEAAADGTSGILRVTQDGKPVKDPETDEYILGDSYPLNLYYAYGIRNSFGIDFDPITGNLWDTENGPVSGDEINLVAPGFNSGYDKIQGIWELENRWIKGDIVLEPDNLVDFDGKGEYSQPEFIWDYPAAPTALKFFSSSNYGSKYENDLFVGSFNEQALYHFDLNTNRTELDLHGSLADKIAEKTADVKDYILGERLGRITDLEIGPDGNLYVMLSHVWDTDPVLRNGSIYKIVPNK